MAEQMYYKGSLRYHNDWVTQIATNIKFPDTLLSASRGKINFHFLVKIIEVRQNCLFKKYEYIKKFDNPLPFPLSQ